MSTLNQINVTMTRIPTEKCKTKELLGIDNSNEKKYFQNKDLCCQHLNELLQGFLNPSVHTCTHISYGLHAEFNHVLRSSHPVLIVC